MCSSTEQDHVTWLDKHYLVNGEFLADLEYSKSHTSGNHIAVCHDEAKVLLLESYTYLLKFPAWNPSVLTSYVNKDLRNTNAIFPFPKHSLMHRHLVLLIHQG